MTIKLLILVHTEESFDWEGEFSRKNTDVSHIPFLDKYQQLFSYYGATVAYALTYPVLESQIAIDFFKKLASNKKVFLGMHCHPWVNPPYEEEVNAYNSYPSNLSVGLERAKICDLSQKISDELGCTPSFYLAGRYGVRNETYKVLNELGIKYDFSPVPFYDYSEQFGPDFSNISTRTTLNNDVRVIPHSSGFTGWLSKGGARPWVLKQQQLVKYRISSIFSKLGGFSQVLLSPEGFTLNEMKELTKKLVFSNHETLVLSFHSPSIKFGNTPFVKTVEEEGIFFSALEAYLKFFKEEIQGEFMLLSDS